MTNVLERILAVLDERGILRSAGEDSLIADIVDAVWLAVHFPYLAPPRNQDDTSPSTTALSGNQPVDATVDAPQLKPISAADPIHTDSAKGESDAIQLEEVEKPKSIQSRRIGLPETPAWRHALDMERALRPLARRKPSKLQWKIDENETAHLIAESDVWQAAFSPLPAKWLEAVFIIERSPTMRVWSQPALEFQRMLWRVGAFRWAETFFLDGFEQDKEKPLRLFSVVGNVEYDPDNICHPTAPRVIFFCSDCVGPAWRNGVIPQWLETWSKHNLTVVLQTLPEDEWRRTTLRYANIEEMAAHLPLSLPQIADKRAIPVASLSEPQSLRDLANFIIAAPRNRVPCFSIKAFTENIKSSIKVAPSKQSPPDLTAEHVAERFRRFMETASPAALDLARYMAAVPLRLPYMRLIQRQLLPDAHPAQLAEVLNSGILRKIKQSEILSPMDENDNEVEYEFLAAGNFDIRSWLLGQRSKTKTKKLNEIEERLPLGGLTIPVLDYEIRRDQVDNFSESVTRSFSARWKRLEYYEEAERLENAFIQEKEKSASLIAAQTDQSTNNEVSTGYPLTTEEKNVQRVFDILESTEKYLHIYGAHGIGKTRFVKRLLEEFPDRSAYIDVAGNEQVLELLHKAYSALYSESDVAQLNLAEIAQQWAKKIQTRSASYDVVVLDHFDRLPAPVQMADELRKTILPALEKNIPQASLRLRFIIVAQTKIEVLCERNYSALAVNWAVLP